MLVGALAVTVVGFILLVLALALSSAWLAWACIVVCVIGFGLLIADVLGMRRPEAETAAPQQADYPPEPAAQADVAPTEVTEVDSRPAAETAEPQDAQQAGTAQTVPGAESAPAAEPLEQSVPQVADEGADEQADRTE